MLSKRLKMAREAKNMTQDDVANFINVKRQAYSAYERNISVPDANTLALLAELFGVTTDYLLGRDEIESENKEIDLTEKEIQEIKKKAENFRSSIMGVMGMAFDGKPEGDEETLEKVLLALEEGATLAKKEAKEKYTPKKYKKN